jgi:hypothetical protein
VVQEIKEKGAQRKKKGHPKPSLRARKVKGVGFCVRWWGKSRCGEGKEGGARL